MKIEKLTQNIHPQGLVQLKEMGNILEVRSMSRTPTMPIKKLDKDFYVVLGTGEVKSFKHTTHRTDNLTSVAQSLKHLREYINSNVIDPRKALFITLTYAENMTEGQRLYDDFRKFNMRLAYYTCKHELPPYEYIVAIEPQARGSLHAHLLLIFDKKAPFILAADLAQLWGKGARLKLYPKGFRLFRKSRGIVPPTITDCTHAEAMQKVGNAALTYEKTIKLTDDDGKTCNVINYRHYNKKRKNKQTGGVPNSEKETGNDHS